MEECVFCDFAMRSRFIRRSTKAEFYCRSDARNDVMFGCMVHVFGQ